MTRRAKASDGESIVSGAKLEEYMARCAELRSAVERLAQTVRFLVELPNLPPGQREQVIAIARRELADAEALSGRPPDLGDAA